MQIGAMEKRVWNVRFFVFLKGIVNFETLNVDENFTSDLVIENLPTDKLPRWS